MSLSINPYSTGSSYSTTQSDSSNTVTGRHHSHHPTSKSSADKEQGTASDSVQLSPEMMDYLSGCQNQAPVSTGNYGSDSNDTALTAEQKKMMLTDMQKRLSSLSASQTSDSSGNGADGATDAIATVKSELSGFDASSATDSQVSDLFDEVMQTLKSSRPSFNGDNAQPPAGGPGLPPMMKAMGGITPPFAWGLNGSQEDSEQSNDAANTLTTEQKKSILANIQNKLSSLDSIESGSGESANSAGTGSAAKTIYTIKNALSGFDSSTATDQSVSDLFDEVTQAMEQFA